MSDDTPSGTPKDTHYATLRRAHRDRKRTDGGAAPAGALKRRPQPGRPAPAGRVRLYGIHTVAAALNNPHRKLHSLLVTRNALARLEIAEDAIRCPVEMVEPKRLDAELGGEAVHQGVMLETEPLPAIRLSDLGKARLVIVLDQVTDPHNVGAILRSATAFGADALVTTARHSPQESGVLAKAASGALEHVTQIEVVNLADALSALSKQGFRTIGLDSDGPESFEASLSGERIAIVLGAEGKGLRQKTQATVDALARLEMPGAIRSLNVSNAAAIALYATRRHLG
ncbi:RNA methyltransferase, TrmH family, group 3 [Aurantimonas manganoxydans SI85-9A1]|uniref:RNA methyltransferase, TrmH family, group 3 n=1 Tax=Aurantimonas manganoxydans (strain ATCC BAA-1229 / DSM 21871 / SI85-9A1) TaxID=287752 RepID=Q1YNC7_AURMS|nr:23S rRNA (guanosine(2251)-2'-O)-methyltransferase RlmB [Aurantimonas manganoxydans]EAS51104.1 RNA methyltransferase, TrmH family, group 3 [Aurantimonas manganoxydans SI85-9A1]